MNESDIVLLSETWSNKMQVLKLSEYAEPICKHRVKKKNAKRESGGLVCFFRTGVLDGISEVKWDFEDGMCLKLDKCFFGWERDMYILFVYMRPGTSSRGDLDVDVDIFELLEQHIAKVSELGDVM